MKVLIDIPDRLLPILQAEKDGDVDIKGIIRKNGLDVKEAVKLLNLVEKYDEWLDKSVVRL